MTTIGIIGSGNIGTAVARAAIAKGDDVVIANSRGPESLADPSPNWDRMPRRVPSPTPRLPAIWSWSRSRWRRSLP